MLLQWILSCVLEALHADRVIGLLPVYIWASTTRAPRGQILFSILLSVVKHLCLSGQSADHDSHADSSHSNRTCDTSVLQQAVLVVPITHT